MRHGFNYRQVNLFPTSNPTSRKINAMKTSRFSAWANQYLDSNLIQEYDYSEYNGILIQAKLRELDKTIWTDSVFATRALTPYSTTWCEQKLGESLFDKGVASATLGAESLVMDLGCGDGRYVHAMLKRGAKRIIALNYELEPLLKLKSVLTEEQQQQVFLICGDINENPLQPSIGTFIVAWSLWTSTPDFTQSMHSTLRLVKPSGLLLNAEPVLEHALLYALVMGDHEEFFRTLVSKTRPRMWDERETRYRVQTLRELRQLMRNPHLEIIWENGINVMPSLLFGGLLTRTSISDDTKAKFWTALQETEIEWFRQMVYLSRKVA